MEAKKIFWVYVSATYCDINIFAALRPKKGKKSNLIDPAVSVWKLMSSRSATRPKYL
jgi:hypothetical protein